MLSVCLSPPIYHHQVFWLKTLFSSSIQWDAIRTFSHTGNTNWTSKGQVPKCPLHRGSTVIELQWSFRGRVPGCQIYLIIVCGIIISHSYSWGSPASVALLASVEIWQLCGLIQHLLLIFLLVVWQGYQPLGCLLSHTSVDQDVYACDQLEFDVVGTDCRYWIWILHYQFPCITGIRMWTGPMGD